MTQESLGRQLPPSATTGERVMCARHRNVETHLRCGKCGTPICPKCLVHTPVGARCPDCARPARIVRRGGLAASALGVAAGLGVGMLTGILMTFVPGGLMLLPLLLGGFLVGEAISAASRRRGGRHMQIAAFFCAVLGPLFGRALVLVLLANVPPAVALNGAIALMGLFGLLLLLAGGVIASTRIDR